MYYIYIVKKILIRRMNNINKVTKYYFWFYTIYFNKNNNIWMELLKYFQNDDYISKNKF